MLEEKVHEFTLPYAGGERKIRVYVPAHEDGETFPVVYMTDGQNVFDDESSAFGSWHTREAVRAEREKSGRAAIIVGIHNDGKPKERTDELTPKSIGKLRGPLPLRIMVKPQGEIFDDFVVNTVMPAVGEKFPVKKGREFTAFCGSSSGGLQSYFTALSHPELFCAAGVFSPAFTLFSNDDLRRFTTSCIRPRMPYLYIYSGDDGRLEKKICKSTEAACEMLATYYPKNRFCKEICRGAPHNEGAWEPIFVKFLHRFLSADQK